MREIKKFNAEEQQVYDEWVAERPEAVREVILRKPPTRLYRMDSGHNAFILKYDEPVDGSAISVTVIIAQEHNPHLLLVFDRHVFGIDPDALEELPELAGGDS